MGKLIVRKEFIESEVHFSFNGASRKVTLKTATQDQLKQVQAAGVDVFEKPIEKAK